MRKGFFRSLLAWPGSVAGVLTAAGLASAQAAAPSAPPAVVAVSPGPTVDLTADGAACGPRIWGSAEYLLWWSKSTPLPVPVLTTGPIGVNGPGGRPGTLGEPGTVLLLGNENIGFGGQSGGRFSAGTWLGAGRVGVEGSYLFLAERSSTRSFAEPGTAGSPPLSIPFFDTTIGAENTTGVALPRGSGFSGVADLTVRTRLQGAEVNGVLPLGERNGNLRLELLAGFRWLQLDENLDFNTVSTNVPPQTADIFVTGDHFGSDNDFYGGQVGLRGETTRGRVTIGATGKVALGTMHEATRIRGTLVTNDFDHLGPAQTFPAGYFALPTNIGDYSRDRFAVVPELNLTVGYVVTDHIRATVGYSYLYVSDVARPGDQIDRVINPSQGPGFTGAPSTTLTGAARPTFLGRDSEFWAHGLSFGIEVRY